jgi:DNA-directed RNA polymerase II subunit RPB2
MAKQAIGVNAINFDQRMDTMAHLLWYQQRPIVTTKNLELMSGDDDLHSGINAIVAICCYSGYNQIRIVPRTHLCTITHSFVDNVY